MKELVLPLITRSKGSENYYNLDLCYLEDEQSTPPKIAFIVEEDEVVEDLDNLGVTGSELVKEAFKNLANIDIKYEDANKSDRGLLQFDQKHASEKILDKNFTENIGKELGTDKILVSLPARNSLLICAADNESATQSLIQESQRIYNDFSKESISLLVFTMENGAIKSAFSPKVDIDSLEEMETSSGSYTVDVSKAKLFDELYNYRVLAKAEKMEDLQNGLFQTVLKLLKESQGDKNFERKIEIISSGSEIKKNRSNAEKVKMLLDRIAQNHDSGSSRAQDKPIQLSFQFHTDFQQGNNHNKIIKQLN